MSIYSELTRLGMRDEEASKLASVTNIHDALVTKQDLLIAKQELQTSIAKLEVRILVVLISTMLGMTGLFAFIVSRL